MGSVKPDPSTRVYPEPTEQPDLFDSLPDSLLLLVFNKIGDVKALGRCCVVSKRFHSLVPQVENVVVRVDCVISDDDPSTSSADAADSSRSFLRSFLRLFLSSVIKPIQSLTQLINPHKRSISSLAHGCNGIDDEEDADPTSVTHHSPTQVLRNFDEIKFLRIELPSGELGIDDGVLLKWRANFGSTLDNCVILGASSIGTKSKGDGSSVSSDADNGSIPESFYTNGGLKLRVVWTISSLIAASARHYLLQPIIAEHKTLDSLILTDVDGQGVLCMNKEQLEELRVKPLSASSAPKRTLVPALNMRLWYAPHLDLPDGKVLKGATLVAIRPSEQSQKEVGADATWVAASFEEPFGTAARMLVKRRTYCLEMNSF